MNRRQALLRVCQFVAASRRGPKVRGQYPTATEVRNKSQLTECAKRHEDQGCSAISVTVDIYLGSHPERSMHNGLVRSRCQMQGVPRNEKGELVYQPDD